MNPKNLAKIEKFKSIVLFHPEEAHVDNEHWSERFGNFSNDVKHKMLDSLGELLVEPMTGVDGVTGDKLGEKLAEIRAAVTKSLMEMDDKLFPNVYRFREYKILEAQLKYLNGWVDTAKEVEIIPVAG